MKDLKTGIRAAINDVLKTDREVFEYSSSLVFTLSEENISSITTVKKNSTTLTSEQYSFDSDTNELTILVALISTDKITVTYKYYKYSSTELDSYIIHALSWISILSSCEKDFEYENEIVEPTPTNKDLDLIIIIASILIKPNYSFYKTPSLTVRYPKVLSKEKKIEEVISRYNGTMGVIDVLTWD